MEYVRQLVEVDEIHLHKCKKKGRMNFPIVMGGYAIHNKRGLDEAIKDIGDTQISKGMTMEV